MHRLLGLADDHFQSWAYWSLKDFHDFTTMDKTGPIYAVDGTLEQAKLKFLSRTYAQAIAGVPSKMTFDPQTASFLLRYRAEWCSGAPTEIYLNEKLHYPIGYSVSVEPTISWFDRAPCGVAESPETNRIFVRLHPKCIGREITIQISKKETSPEITV